MYSRDVGFGRTKTGEKGGRTTRTGGNPQEKKKCVELLLCSFPVKTRKYVKYLVPGRQKTRSGRQTGTLVLLCENGFLVRTHTAPQYVYLYRTSTRYSGIRACCLSSVQLLGLSRPLRVERVIFAPDKYALTLISKRACSCRSV